MWRGPREGVDAAREVPGRLVDDGVAAQDLDRQAADLVDADRDPGRLAQARRLRPEDRHPRRLVQVLVEARGLRAVDPLLGPFAEVFGEIADDAVVVEVRLRAAERIQRPGAGVQPRQLVLGLAVALD